ncbi:MAG: hypothetical protein EXQ87_13540 [Alphaproteobacteria bacterium]|nr:hypothetical protein [Alphaproteobacteria bacterium]
MKPSIQKSIIVGGNLDEAIKRVGDALRRLERGERVKPRDNVTFVTWSALASVMTDKRYELLCHLHQHPASRLVADAACPDDVVASVGSKAGW